MTDLHRNRSFIRSASRAVGTLCVAGSVPLLLTATMGCRVDGERAASGTCPAGEVCSPNAPDGLAFEGADLGGSLFGFGSIAPVAVGGVQRVTFARREMAPLPLVEVVSSAPETLAITSFGQGTADLRGVADGTALVRVLEVDDDERTLLDRIAIESRTIDRVELGPAGRFLTLVGPIDRPYVYRPGHHTLAVHLLDRDGKRLVDEAMEITARRGVIGRSDETPWDEVGVTVESEPIELEVLAGGERRFDLRVEPAGPVDDAALETWLYETDEEGTLYVYPEGIACAIGLAGGAHVIGAPEPGIEIAIGGRVLESNPFGSHVCASIPEEMPHGATEITVRLGDVAHSTPIVISEDLPPSSSALLEGDSGATLRTPRFALGERARAALLAD